MSDEKRPERHAVNTGGGSHVGGDVDTGGGDFVGRDKVDRRVSIGGSAYNANIVTGDHNTVSNRTEQYQEGVSIDDLLQLLGEIRLQAGQVGLDDAATRAIDNAEREVGAGKPDPGEVLHQLERLDRVLKTVDQASEAGRKLAGMVGRAIAWAKTLFGTG